jgi:glyoxylase-like metal-dependent hydrolase (beta-lactamase superfamily II)
VAGLLDLGEDVWVSQTPLWQTNAVLALAGGEALLVDPGFEPSEIESLTSRARDAGGAIHLLVTHGDYDHVCGIAYLPEASVVAGPATAERIASGTAGDQLAAAGAEWGFDWPTALRVDRVVEPGRVECGAFRVEAVDAAGHTADGLAYLLVDQGVLVAGDYLSDMTYPFVGAGFETVIATHRRLLDVLERDGIRWVVPGHGRPLSRAEAVAVGEADLAYLESLTRAVAESREEGLSSGHALLRVFEVEPPRATTPDFEIYALRAANAQAALARA